MRRRAVVDWRSKPMLGDEATPTLEGRDAEEAALWSALEQARAGHGGVVVVSGEAGIGKSALLQRLAARATPAGVRPVWGRAWEFADAPAYFPLGPCLSALGLSAASASGDSAFGFWEQVLEALSRASGSEPVLWLLEDLHAADLQTLDLLTFLAQPVRVMPVLLVVTTRPRDPRLGERSEQRLLRMARDGIDLRLAPLGAEQVSRLARQHAGELPDSALKELIEITSGNPLFVLECARSLKARGLHSLRGVPPTISQVVLERLRLLPEATRELLESGSVLGRDFTAALLSRLHERLPARVVDQLLPALRSGVLLERAPGSFAFSHVVVQEAVYGSVPAERQCALHHKALHALAALPQSPEISLERARHALGALSPETAAAALELALGAGRALEDSGAFDRANALYHRLREKAAGGELSRELSGLELLHMAHIAERAGRSGESRGLSLEVLKRAQDTGERELFALAALELGRGLRPGLIDDELVAALREALAQQGDPDAALSCRLLARLAAALQPAPDPQVPVEMALDAIARARRLGDPALLLEVLDVGGSACVEYAPLDVRLQVAQELFERAQQARDFLRTQRGRARLAFERATLGDFEAFDLHVADMLRDGRASGSPHARVRPLLMASLSALNHGNFAESASLVAEAQQLLALTDDPSLQLSFGAHRLFRVFLHYRPDELERTEPELTRMVSGTPEARVTMLVLRGYLRTRLGRREAALDDLRTVWPLVGRGIGVFITLLAETAAFVREPEICRQCQQLLAPLAGTEGLGGHVSLSYEGPIDRLRGLIDAALGDLAAAEKKLRATLALAETRGFSPWVAQGRLDLAELLLEAGRRSEAEPLWQSAAELAEQLEMPGLAARARARLSGDSVAAASAPQVPAPLSIAREGELYRLERGPWSARIRATRGAELLARLIETPDQEIHVLALASDEATSTSESNAGEQVDRAALRQYRARLEDLTELLSEAEARADLGRLSALRREQAALEAEVSRALGLGGKSRQAGSTSERARSNVQRRLKDAIERVSEVSPELGAWLSRCVRTGTYCSFRTSS